MIIATAWTKAVSETKVIPSGIITVINIFIWYYILNTFVNDINNFSLIVLYVSGCAAGTMIMTYYFKQEKKRKRAQKKLAKSYGKERVDATIR